jgi:hypothetical protein
MPVFYVFFILRLFYLTFLANLHHFLISTPHFLFNALWLPTISYAKYTWFTHFNLRTHFRNSIVRKPKAECM